MGPTLLRTGVLSVERRDAGVRRPASELAGGGRQAVRRRRAAGDLVGGPRDTQAAVGGGQDQGGQQAVTEDLRPAQVSDRSLFAHSLLQPVMGN